MRFRIRELLCSLFIIVCFSNCNKADDLDIDKPESELKNQKIHNTFFDDFPSSDPFNTALREYVIGEETKFYFADDYLQKLGRPNWDKTITFQSAEDSSMSYIPFVKENSYNVTAAIAIKIKGKDTSSTMLFPGAYKKYGFIENGSKLSARGIFHIFSSLEQLVFKTNKFIITDSRLLSATYQSEIEKSGFDIKGGKITYTLHNGIAGQTSGISSRLVQNCTRADICLAYATYRSAKDQVTVQSMPAPCIWWSEEVTCQTYWIDDPSTPGGGGGGGDTGGGGDWPPVPDPCAPPSDARSGDCDNSPGWTPILAAQIQAYQNMLAPGDGFDFNVATDGTFFTYNSIADFQAFKDATADPNNTLYDMSAPAVIINQNEKIQTAKFNLNFVGGVSVDVKLEHVNNLWKVKGVESDTWGSMPFMTWNQSTYASSVTGNVLTVDVKGKVSYNVIFQGIGTIYKQELRFQMKFNNITGEFISISRL